LIIDLYLRMDLVQLCFQEAILVQSFNFSDVRVDDHLLRRVKLQFICESVIQLVKFFPQLGNFSVVSLHRFRSDRNWCRRWYLGMLFKFLLRVCCLLHLYLLL